MLYVKLHFNYINATEIAYNFVIHVKIILVVLQLFRMFWNMSRILKALDTFISKRFKSLQFLQIHIDAKDLFK